MISDVRFWIGDSRGPVFEADRTENKQAMHTILGFVLNRCDTKQKTKDYILRSLVILKARGYDEFTILELVTVMRVIGWATKNPNPCAAIRTALKGNPVNGLSERGGRRRILLSYKPPNS